MGHRGALDAGKFQATDDEICVPGYFETMRMRLLVAGRFFTDADNLPGRNVVVIDDILANKAFHGASAVGGRILIRLRTPEAEWVEVIGGVISMPCRWQSQDANRSTHPLDAFVGSGAVDSWAIRTGNDPTNYGNAVRAAIKEVDSHLLVTEIQPVESLNFPA